MIVSVERAEDEEDYRGYEKMVSFRADLTLTIL